MGWTLESSEDSELKKKKLNQVPVLFLESLTLLVCICVLGWGVAEIQLFKSSPRDSEVLRCGNFTLVNTDK